MTREEQKFVHKNSKKEYILCAAIKRKTPINVEVEDITILSRVLVKLVLTSLNKGFIRLGEDL